MSVYERLDTLNIALPKITPPVATFVPFVRRGLVRVSGQARIMTYRKWIERLRQAMFCDYLRGRAFCRFSGTPLRLLVTGFFVLAASNKCRMPCSNSPTALSKAPSCPSRTIAMDMCKSNDGGRNTLTLSRELLLAIKRAGSNPTPYPD